MTTLLLSTPDGIPGGLLNLFQTNLFDIVVSNRGNTGHHGGLRALGQDIGRLHDKILSEQQKTWFQLNERELPTHKNEALLEKMKAVMTRLPAAGEYAIHDPAMVFFAPFWQLVLPRPVLAFYYSEPLESAVQLRNLWRFPISFGLALWEYYVCRALNLLVASEHVLVSSRKLRQDPTGHVLETAMRLERHQSLKQTPRKAGASAQALQLESIDNGIDPEVYLNDAQKRLYSELESGRIQETEYRVCEQSRDVLFHYGNLRAGFEGFKQECRTLALALRRAGGDKEEMMPERSVDASLPELNNDDGLLDVVVHIKHMEPLVFAAPPDSPVLDMLFNALQAPASDARKVIFLQYGVDGSDTLYFPVGSLLAVDTSGATAP